MGFSLFVVAFFWSKFAKRTMSSLGVVIPYYLSILPQDKKNSQEMPVFEGFFGQKKHLSADRKVVMFPEVVSPTAKTKGGFSEMEKSYLSNGSLGWEIPKCQNSGFRSHGEIWARFYTSTSSLTSFLPNHVLVKMHSLQTLTNTPELCC